MHNMNVFHPIKHKALTYNKQKKLLSSLMFFKEKRDSSIKTCVYANERKQKDDT